MSSETSSTTKVLIGCLLAFVVGVLACAGAIVLVGYWGIGVARQVAQDVAPKLAEQLKEQGERMHFADAWQPPEADSGSDQLFPSAVGNWSLSGHDDLAAIPELAIDRDGLHGIYESAGTRVDVYVYQVPINAQAQVFGAAGAAIDGAGYRTQSRDSADMGVVHWMLFNFSPPERYGRMWWAKDWLIVLMTDSAAVDLDDFEKNYLNAIQRPSVTEKIETLPGSAAAPADGEPAEQADALATDTLPDVNDPAFTDPPNEPPAPAPSERQAH